MIVINHYNIIKNENGKMKKKDEFMCFSNENVCV